MEKIYLDNAATTPLAEEALDAMVAAMKVFGNPSSTHSYGQEAKMLIEHVRRQIADYLHVTPGEIIFTSCGTESNNMIIKSAVDNLGIERIITSPLEHKCVAESVQEVKKKCGIEVAYLRPDENGDLSLDKLEELLQASEKKTLVTLMHANNEIGNLLDIWRVGELTKKYNALFHSDTVQTVAHMPLDFSETQVDFASCSAHKFHGPKGAGFAFIRKSSGLKALISGGPQERSLRAGTENVAGIVGMGKALELSLQHMKEYADHMQGIKNYAVEQFQAKIPGVAFNGHSADAKKSLYTVLSVRLPFRDPLVGMKLDMKGIAVSQGSACSSGAAKPSMVMMMILTEEQMEKTTPLRVSFSHLTTQTDVDALVNTLADIQKELN